MDKRSLDALVRECIHCGLCLESCPTYSELRRETHSPRGRIHLMKALLDGKLDPQTARFDALDSCLGCRACETACPSGVQYGHLLESVRARFVHPHRKFEGKRLVWQGMLDHLIPYPRRLKLGLSPLAMLRRKAPGLLDEATRRLPPQLARPLKLVTAPDSSHAALSEWTPATGERRGTVALLTGCIMQALYDGVHHATIRMLARSGYDVWIPPSQTCCGALHAHEGDRTRALAFMGANLEAFSRDGLSAILTNSAGCGAAMKDYGHWLDHGDPMQGRASEFAGKTRDICEFLAEVGIPTPTRSLEWKVAYDDPCHLAHGQGVREAPRSLLRQIPGLQLVPLAESDWCCGGAGSFTLLQIDLSDRLLDRKLAHIRDAAPDAVVTGNPSCLMQLGMGLRRTQGPPLFHTIEVLDKAYLGT